MFHDLVILPRSLVAPDLAAMDLMWMFPRDPRFEGLIWDYPSIILGIVLFYLIMVLKVGPAWMSTREPIPLRTATRAFNLFQVLANIWFSYHVIAITYRNYYTGLFSFGCNPPSINSTLDNKEDELMLGAVTIFYLWVRILDLLDTAFFVLAKKQSHVTFLHVYHHVIVVCTFYVYLRSGWSPSIFYVGIINSLVHVVMYSYYFLSTFPTLRPYLWWKKYLTALQIVQFCVFIIQIVWNTLFNCGYPITVFQYNFVQMVIFLGLFTRFYLFNYGKQEKTE